MIIDFDPKYAETCREFIVRSFDSIDSLEESTKNYLMRHYTQPGYLEEKSQEYSFYLYMEQETPVAIGALKGNEVLKFYIDTEYQGKGIARKLMTHIEGVARTRGLTELMGYAIDNSYPILLYGGWKEQEKMVFDNNGHPLPVTIVTKKL